MNLSELEDHVAIMLRQLMVQYKKTTVLRKISSQFIVADFGLVICCINRVDYAQVSSIVLENFKDWRINYITTNDNMMDCKFKVLWELMRCGYMKWLRYTYPRQVKNVINGPENLGQRIIEERLRVWANKPMYKFLIDDNKAVLKSGILRELTNDPSFFDYMPESGGPVDV